MVRDIDMAFALLSRGNPHWCFNDVNCQCVVHKFIHDATVTEILLKGNESAHSGMQQYLDNLHTWSTNNCMVINSNKTKEMILVTANKSPPPLLTICNSPVERVTCFKLLGINICNDLLWDACVLRSHQDCTFLSYLLRRHIGFGSSSRLTCACLSVGSVGRVEYIIICF